MWITKASGKIEKFNINKIKRTCIRSGVSKDKAEEIANQVQARAKNGMSTQEILNMTLSLLRRVRPDAAARYDLKGALLRLGPAGFAFEQYVAEILREYGFNTKVHTLIQGGSGVTHEIDLVITSNLKKIPSYACGECKYHNSPGIFTGMKEAMYTYARFLDLQEGFKKGVTQRFDQMWLITNTKFSKDAVQYCQANNVKLLGWDYPIGASLRNMIEDKKLYPITVLRKLDEDAQVKMAEANLILVKDILNMTVEKLNAKTGIRMSVLKELKLEAEKVVM